MITDASRATTLMACFNCAQKSEQVHLYRFDLDLPSIPACRECVVALSLGDFDMLAALRPGRRGVR